MCGSAATVRGARRRGFTLVELVSVMAIAVLLMGLTAAGYFGYIRSSLVNRTVGNVRAKMLLARQRAVTSRRTLYVLPGNGALRMYETLGLQSNPNSETVPQVEFQSDLPFSTLSAGLRVYKPNAYNDGIKGTESTVTTSIVNDVASIYNLNAASLKWRMGEPCAVLIDEYPYPDGIVIATEEGSPAVLAVYSDGTVSVDGMKMVVKEEIGKLSAKLTVVGICGTVTLDDRYVY